MSGFSFTTTLHGKQYDYTVRTMNFDSIHRIVINLNDDSKVINTREIPYDSNLADEKLMENVKRCHEERVNALQELMKISAKLETKPEVDSNHKLGLVFLNNGMGRETIMEFKRALSLSPDNAPILNHLGLALLLEEKYAEAIKVFKRAVEIKPTYPDLHNNYGLALLKTEQYDEALGEFELAVDINKKYAEAHFNIGLCLVSRSAQNGQGTPAMKEKIQNHLQRAVESNVYFNNEYYKVAQNYLAKDQYAEARQALIEAKTAVLSQTGSEIYHEFYLRLKYGEEGVDRKATEQYISKLEDILDRHPQYVDIHNDLGVAYLIQCRFLFNRAINEFKKALAINSEYTQAKKNLKLAENEGKGFLILLRAILYF
ncbi:tetratricopeptide repeat protein [candidate division FCPU426 bacterium]|nr:tetratricopeptide repeat protein [candidate division FCPU426 bacterium]